MNASLRNIVSAIACVLLATTAVNTHAVTFSIDIGSAFPAPPDDILIDPGGPGPAVVVIPTGGFAETDAFTYGESGVVDESILYFSVDPASAGAAATAVAAEAAGAAGGPGDHPADVFSSMFIGGNLQIWDGNAIPNPGAAPNLGLAEPIAPAGDNVDGLDLRSPGPTIFWSVDPATIVGSLPYAGLTPADIFVAAAVPGYSGGPFGVYAALPALGLLPGDDIDALEIIEDGVAGFGAGDTVFFSLTPGSPTLVGLGASPADLLAVGGIFGLAPIVFAPAGTLGLLPTDNIDALDFAPIPLPAAVWLLGSAIGLLGWAVRKTS
jgi:hypothetical protein